MGLVNISPVSGINSDPPCPQNDYQLIDRAEPGSAANYLPKGFPSYLFTNMAWNGSELAGDWRYVYRLKDSDILEIDAALTAFKDCELDGDLVNSENFPLPKLQNNLRKLCYEVHHGKGFFLMRGLDLKKYSVEDGMIIFLGIQSYIAQQRGRQDDRGNMIVHIISDSTAFSSPIKSLHSRHSNSSIAFHTEETGDIIAWQTRNTAARGGRCIISSAHTIYNVLAATRPDIIRTLARPDWPFAFPSFHYRPILFYHDSHLIINFCRAALLGSSAHPRPLDMPSLTSRQREALDVVEAVAITKQLDIPTQAGDLHFLNNLTMLHRREEFVDGEELKGSKRHLVRMRLRSESEGWSIPDELSGDWWDTFEDAGERIWHIEPMPEAFFPLRKYLL